MIGSEDSVQLALRIAEEEGRASDVAAGGYRKPEETPAIASELDNFCQVLLFTGRVPYALAHAAGPLNAETSFISHSGADLYRTLACMLIANRGRLPTVSVDTIESETIREIYLDIGLEPPLHVLPIADDEGNLLFSNTAEITQFHRDQYRSGAVGACLTCLGVAFRELQADNVPVWRVEHTHATVREALRQAWLSEEVLQSRSTQLAVVLVQLGATRARASDTYSRERTRLRTQESLLRLAKALRGRLHPVDDSTYLISTTRGVVETAIARHRAGYASHLMPRELQHNARLGFGIGGTVSIAEENARHALRLSQQTGGTQVVFPDGAVYSTATTGARHVVRLRETTPGVLQIAAQLQLGPLSTRRLVDALNRLDTDAVTARALADAYGVETRSGRRLLRTLKQVGYAEEVGLQTTGGAGRPETVFKVHLRNLVAAMSDPGSASPPDDSSSHRRQRRG